MGKWALAYARRGLYVFPCHWPVNGGCSCGHADCDSLAKHPKTLRGLLDATTDEDTINRWWKRWPEANIGVAVGMSGRLVIDIGPRNGGNEAFAALLAREGIELETFTVQTGGGGFHYYYLAPADLGEINKSIAHGVDCKGIGGYVLGAGSLHMSAPATRLRAARGKDRSNSRTLSESWLRNPCGSRVPPPVHERTRAILWGHGMAGGRSRRKLPRFRHARGAT